MVKLQVDKTKSYSRTTFAMAHDSHTCEKWYSDTDSVHGWIDQTLPPSLQFEYGIRAVRISTGNPVIANLPYWGDVIVQHTIALGTFKDYLKQVVAFLAANREEIITIIDEGDPSTPIPHTGYFSAQDWWDAVTDVYVDCLSDGTQNGSDNPELRLKPGTDATTHVYVPEVGADGLIEWPTLQTMIDNNTRLVVMMSSKQEGSVPYPWVIPAYAGDQPNGVIGMNYYDKFYGDKSPDGYFDPNTLKSKRWPSSGGGPQLYLFNHYFYQDATIDESSREYNNLAVGINLVRDVLNAWNTLRIQPNFINTDFVQGVWGTRSYLIDLVNAMNTQQDWSDACHEVLKAFFIPQVGSYAESLDNITLTLQCDLKDQEQNVNKGVKLDLTPYNGIVFVGNDDGKFKVSDYNSIGGAGGFDYWADPGFHYQGTWNSLFPSGNFFNSAENIMLTLAGTLKYGPNAGTVITKDLTQYVKGYIEVDENYQLQIYEKEDHPAPVY